MTSLYPSILFHFTKNKASLLGILKDEFQVSYAKERIESSGGRARVFAAPMVSFCDLRVSELPTHIASYGYYRIGLSKEWANRNKLNPVSYWSRDGRLIENFMDYLDLAFARRLEMGQAEVEAYHNLMDIYRFTKNYEGDLKRRNGEEIKGFRFANEREWRYVPSIQETNLVGADPFVSETSFDGSCKCRWNETLKDLQPLHFDPRDIRYIVVEKEGERKDIIDFLENEAANGQKYGEDEVKILSSRILSATQILDDI